MSRGRDKFQQYKWIINSLAYFFSIFPKNFNKKLFVIFRNLTGHFGLVVRYVLLKNISKIIGDNVSIHPGIYIFSPENIQIGDNVSVHPMCYIDSTGGIKIGNDVSIAHSSTVLSTNHSYSDATIPIKNNDINYSQVIIEDDVWIGCGCRILAGVNVSSRSIIAAGAVIVSSVPPKVIMGGVPAKIIKYIK